MTPNDLSTTWIPLLQPNPSTVYGIRTGGMEATDEKDKEPNLLDYPFRDSRELILALLYLFNGGLVPEAYAHLSFNKIAAWRGSLGSAKVLWQVLENVMQSGDEQILQAIKAEFSSIGATST